MHKVLKNVSLISQIGIYLYLDCENVFTHFVRKTLCKREKSLENTQMHVHKHIFMHLFDMAGIL